MNDRRVSPHLVACLALAFLVVACSGGQATPAPATSDPPAETTSTSDPPAETTSTSDPPAETVEILTVSTQLPFPVAENEGFFEGVDVNVTVVGFGEQGTLFATGDYPVADQAPWEVAEAISQGDDLVFLSTSSGVFASNPVIIRAADEALYDDVLDLEGKTLGIPGFGTGAYSAFATILHSLHGIDAQEAFDIVETDPGTLLPLLETGEIDAALTFAGTGLIADANPDKFVKIFEVNEYWQEETGHPLLVTGLVARAEWIEQNSDQAQAIVDGLDAAVAWMAENPEALLEPPYREWMQDAGWLNDPAQTEIFLDLIRNGAYFATSEVYTQDWIDNQYDFIQNGVGLLITGDPPPKENIFLAP